MKTLVKILKWTGIILVVLLVGLYAFIQLTWDKKYEAPYPDIHASKDSALIARGRYLAFGPAHCGTCHVPMDKIEAVENGLQIPLSGGWEFAIDPGTFRAPNLTPDTATGIGRLTDGEIARTLRHMVGSDGRVIFPFMPFAELTDEDLTAIVSFLRSQEPVKHELKKTEVTFLGKAVMAFGLIKPMGAKGTPPKSIPIDSTVEYGNYIANYVANCVGCHTNRDLKTGAFIGEPFAGGMVFTPDAFSEGKTFRTPNLTPHPTGIISTWTEATFMARMKGGKVHKGTPMPWGAYSRMNDVEIKAVYRYLKSLGPIDNKVEKTVWQPGEEAPKI